MPKSATGSLPSDSQIRAFVNKFVRQNAQENDGSVSVSVREIRSAIAEEFDVEDATLKEERKDVIKQAALDAVAAVEKDEEVASGKGENSDAPDDPLRKASEGDVSEGEDEGEGSGTETHKTDDDDLSSLEDTDLEDDGPKKTKGKRRKSSEGSKKSSSDASSKAKAKGKASSSSAAGTGDKDEDEVARLKKFVTACGVRKVWSKYFSTQSPSADSPRAQIKVLRTLLAELGMDGRLSMDKAKKIKEKREFEEEMEAIGVGVSPADDGDGGRRTRRARGNALSSRRQAQEVSDSGEEDEDDDRDAKGGSRKGRARDSEDEDGGEAPPKKTKRFNASLAAFAAELNSDDE